MKVLFWNMKRCILIGLFFMVFLGLSKAQSEKDEIEIGDEESSGEAPRVSSNNGLGIDDEDSWDDSEGSGEPVILPGKSNSGGEITFENPTEATTPAQGKKNEIESVGKTKNVVKDGEKDPGSKVDEEKEPELEDPVSESDSGKETSEEVKDGDGVSVAATANTPSIQFLATVIVGGCIGLLFAICVIMLLVYRMRKKDEGSYALDYGLDKKPQGNYEYTKGVDSKEYFA